MAIPPVKDLKIDKYQLLSGGEGGDGRQRHCIPFKELITVSTKKKHPLHSFFNISRLYLTDENMNSLKYIFVQNNIKKGLFFKRNYFKIKKLET